MWNRAVRIEFFIKRGETHSRWSTRVRYALFARKEIEKFERIGSPYKLTPSKLEQFKYRLNELEKANDIQHITEADEIARELQFSHLPLKYQCASLGIPLNNLELEKTPAGWLVNGTTFKKPERAALKYFQLQGYQGTCCEGYGAMDLMKCACLDLFKRGTRIDGYKAGKAEIRRSASCTLFVAQCDLYDNNPEEIIEFISKASDDLMRNNIQEFISEGGPTVFHDIVSEQDYWAIWKAFGALALARLATGLLKDSWHLQFGWPDLIITRDGDIKFIEVKTIDRLHESQRYAIHDLLLPAGANVSVLRTSPLKLERQPIHSSVKHLSS